MKKIIQTVADGGGELGVHMYPLSVILIAATRDSVTLSRVVTKRDHV